MTCSGATRQHRVPVRHLESAVHMNTGRLARVLGTDASGYATGVARAVLFRVHDGANKAKGAIGVIQTACTRDSA